MRVPDAGAAQPRSRMLDAGIVAHHQIPTIRPTGYINANFAQTFAALGMTGHHACQLARNSFEANFIDAAQSDAYIERLDAVVHTF